MDDIATEYLVNDTSYLFALALLGELWEVGEIDQFQQASSFLFR